MLTIDDVVKVILTLDAPTGNTSVFDVGLILGSADVINTTERVKTYSSLKDMTDDGFATTSAEYRAAALYFANDPAPSTVMVGVIGDGETPATALTAVLAKTNAFDSVYVCGATAANLSELVTLLDNTVKHLHLWYTVTGTVTEATADNGIFATLKATGSRRCCGLYHHSDEYAGAAAMGALLGKLHAYPNGAVQACYSTLGGLDVSPLSQSDVENIKRAGGNVYISRYNSRGLFENGQTPSGLRIDDSIYLDAMAADLQAACFNLITDQATRLPQSDDTSTQFINAISEVLSGYSVRQVIATGNWTGRTIGSIERGATLDGGYAVWVDSYDNQSAEDRAAHKAMPITVAIILGGSVESVEIDLYAQR